MVLWILIQHVTLSIRKKELKNSLTSQKAVAHHTEFHQAPNPSQVTLWGIPLFIEPNLSQNSTADHVVSDKDMLHGCGLWRLIGVQSVFVPLFSIANQSTKDIFDPQEVKRARLHQNQRYVGSPHDVNLCIYANSRAYCHFNPSVPNAYLSLLW